MSAFVVAPEPLSYLVAAAMRYEARILRHPGNWNSFHRFGASSAWTEFPEPRPIDRKPRSWADFAVAILHEQNERSVRHRYDDAEEEGMLIERPDFSSERLPAIEPLQVLKACDCYDYQACETPDYEQTEAHRFVAEIRSLAIMELPGYDKAAWCIDPELAAATA